MEPEPTVITALQSTFTDTLAAILDYAPFLAGGFAVLLVGWLLARIVRGAARRAISGVNRVLERTFQRGALASTRLSPAAAGVLCEVLFWAVIFLSAAVAARVANLPAVSGWLNQIASWMPNFLIGIVIIVFGYFISAVASEQVSASARSAKVGQSALIGRFAQGGIFITALIIGLDQIGVDVTFLVALFAVSIGAIFVGFSIAFGLGSRDYVSNLIGARTARQKIKPGSTVRIGEIEGEVLEITQTQIALDTADGRTLVPARLTDESAILIVSSDAKGAPQND